MTALLRWVSIKDAETWIDNNYTNAGYEWDSPRQRTDIIRAAWYYYKQGRAQGNKDATCEQCGRAGIRADSQFGSWLYALDENGCEVRVGNVARGDVCLMADEHGRLLCDACAEDGPAENDEEVSQ